MTPQEFFCYCTIETRSQLLENMETISKKSIMDIENNWLYLVSLKILDDKYKTPKNIMNSIDELQNNEKKKLRNILNTNYQEFIWLEKIDKYILSYPFFDNGFDQNKKKLFKNTCERVKKITNSTKPILENFLFEKKYISDVTKNAKWITGDKILKTNINVYELSTVRGLMIDDIDSWLGNKETLKKQINNNDIVKFNYSCYLYFIENYPERYSDLKRKYEEKMQNSNINCFSRKKTKRL